MKRYGIICVVLVFVLTGCEWFSFRCCSHCSGSIIRDERIIESFHEIAVSGRGTLRVAQSDKEAVLIEADAQLMPHIITEVHDGVLHVYTHTSCSCNHDKTPVNYFISVAKVDKITASGEIVVQAPELRAQDLIIEASDASKVEACLYAHSCHIKGAGSPQFTLGGTVESSKIDLVGNGMYNALEMENKECEVSAAGSSHVTMNVSEKLTINAFDETIVEYKGNPSLGIRSSGLSIKNIGA